MIDKGNKVRELYILDTGSLQSLSTAFVNHVSTRVWHNRLGYLSFKKLNSLKIQLHCDVSNVRNGLPCYVCPLAKQQRLSFLCNNNLSEHSFNVVHYDIWGPYHVVSHKGGYHFFLTLVDDCTRFTWVYTMKNKSDVSSLIP